MNLLILKGLLIGFVASISLGPVVIIIIQKTLDNGKLSGLIACLSMAIVDTIFAIIATYSVSSIFTIIESYQIPIRLFGALIILPVGLKLLIRKSPRQTYELKSKISTYRADFFSAFLLALSNPLTILLYAFFFTTFNIIPKGSNGLQLFELYVGVFIGINLWWGLVVFLSNIIRNQFWLKNSQLLNKYIGSFTILFGLILLISLFIV